MVFAGKTHPNPLFIRRIYNEKARLPCDYLHVPVDDVPFVQIVQCHDDFSTVELAPSLAEAPVALEMEEELAAVRKLHDETETIVGLEGVGERLCTRVYVIWSD